MALPAAIRLTCALTLDGVPVSGFPVERRPLGSMLERLTIIRGADGASTLSSEPLPVTLLPASLLLLSTDLPVRLALNDQSQDGVTDIGLQAGGTVLLAAADITAIATANPSIVPATLAVLTLTP